MEAKTAHPKMDHLDIASQFGEMESVPRLNTSDTQVRSQDQSHFWGVYRQWRKSFKAKRKIGSYQILLHFFSSFSSLLFSFPSLCSPILFISNSLTAHSPGFPQQWLLLSLLCQMIFLFIIYKFWSTSCLCPFTSLLLH